MKNRVVIYSRNTLLANCGQEWAMAIMSTVATINKLKSSSVIHKVAWSGLCPLFLRKLVKLDRTTVVSIYKEM